MCIYLTTRDVHRDGRADSVTAEWELCSSSQGGRPCPDKQRRERIVSVQRHKRHPTIGSIASGSSLSSGGPETPSSSYRDDQSTAGGSIDRHATPFNPESSTAGRWSPLHNANLETRRPSSPLRRHNRYRVSIDATLGTNATQKPMILQESSPPSTASARKASPVITTTKTDDSEGEGMTDTTFSGRTARAEGSDQLNREDRQRRRERSGKHAVARDNAMPLPSEEAIHMTSSQEKREQEELMWDAHELRTARRMDLREQLREENRRRQQEEERNRSLSFRAKQNEEALTQASIVRRLAELEVEEGMQEQSALTKARWLAEKSILERRMALTRIEREEAEAARDAERSDRAGEWEDSRLRTQLQREIRDARDRAEQDRTAPPTGLHRIRSLASRRRSSSQAEAQQHAQALRARIEASERTLDALEARIRERRHLEADRQHHIERLERKIEALDRRIASRTEQVRASQAASASAVGNGSPIVEPAEEAVETSRTNARSPRRRRQEDSARSTEHERQAIPGVGHRRGSPSRRSGGPRVSFRERPEIE